MAGCTVIPVTAKKACTGKCKGRECNAAARVWVVAACEGMISLFEKSGQRMLTPLAQNRQGVFASMEQFQKFIDKADHDNVFDQLVIVGAGNDIAWIHASLPNSATRHIVAEIKYPLLPSWFKQSLPLPTLTHALEGIFAV